VFDVLLLRLGIDDYVVEVHQAALPLDAGQDDVQRPLECRGRVFQPEGHAFVVVGPLVADEGRLFAVAVGDEHMPVSGVAVQRRQDLGLAEAVDALVHAWKRVRVALAHGVQESVIDAKPQRTVLLGHQHHEESPFGRRWFDDVGRQLARVLGGFRLAGLGSRAPRRDAHGLRPWGELDVVSRGLDGAQRLARPHGLMPVQHRPDPLLELWLGLG